MSLSIDIQEYKATRKPSSDVFVVSNTMGEKRGVRSLVSLMGEHGLDFFYTSERKKGLIPSDAVVVLKVNSQWDQRGGTNTDLVKSLISLIIEHPDDFVGEVVIADNGQGQYGSTRAGGSLSYSKNNAEDLTQSNEKVASSFKQNKVSTYLWDTITSSRVREYEEGDYSSGYIINDNPEPNTGIRISYPKFTTKYGAQISFKNGVWDKENRQYLPEKLVFLNVPVLKSHFIYGVTGCVKHYMGVVSDKLQTGGAHRSVRTGGMGSMIAGTRPPTLNILDAIYINANCGRGPSCSYDEATQVKMVIASVDPFALDTWATREVIMKAASLQGQSDLTSFDPHSTDAGSFGEWMRKSLEITTRSGLLFTNNPQRISVYINRL